MNGFPLHNCLHLQPHPQKPLHRLSTRTEYSNRLLRRPGVRVYQNFCESLHNDRFNFFHKYSHFRLSKQRIAANSKYSITLHVPFCEL